MVLKRAWKTLIFINRVILSISLLQKTRIKIIKYFKTNRYSPLGNPCIIHIRNY